MDELVSVIMPAYNTAMYIDSSIKSVIAQTYKYWELIIIDDCSTDNTEQIVSEIRDNRIRYIKNEVNIGAALSRNRALSEARGEWIAFLDSDDLWLPEKLEIQIDFMKKHKCYFTFTDYRICLNGSLLPYICTGPNIINKRKMYQYCYFATTTVMYNTNVIGLIQITNIKKNNDYAMWFKAIEKSNAYRVSECLSYYTKRNNSISSGSKLKLIKWFYILYAKELHKNAIVACILTIRNIFFGIVKRIRYKHYISND